MFHVAGTAVHEPPLCGATSKTTVGPGSPPWSSVVAVNVTVPVTLELEAGESSVTSGFVLSIRTFVTGGVETPTLFALSRATTCKS